MGETLHAEAREARLASARLVPALLRKPRSRGLSRRSLLPAPESARRAPRNDLRPVGLRLAMPRTWRKGADSRLAKPWGTGAGVRRAEGPVPQGCRGADARPRPETRSSGRRRAAASATRWLPGHLTRALRALERRELQPADGLGRVDEAAGLGRDQAGSRRMPAVHHKERGAGAIEPERGRHAAFPRPVRIGNQRDGRVPRTATRAGWCASVTRPPRPPGRRPCGRSHAPHQRVTPGGWLGANVEDVVIGHGWPPVGAAPRALDAAACRLPRQAGRMARAPDGCAGGPFALGQAFETFSILSSRVGLTVEPVTFLRIR